MGKWCVSGFLAVHCKPKAKTFSSISSSTNHQSCGNFTKEARRHVSEAVLKQITLLNSLDVELYKQTWIVFEKKHQKLFDSAIPERWQMMNGKSYIAWEVVYLKQMRILRMHATK